MDVRQYEQFARIDREHWWFKARKRIIETTLHNRFASERTMRIIDVGTGTGGMIPVLRQFGSLTVSEPDKQTLEFTRSLYSCDDSIEFIEGDSETLNFPPASFDLLTAFDVLEHCSDDRYILSKWKSWVKRGGTLLLTVPAFSCLWGLNDEFSHHYRRYSKQTMLALLAANNLSVEKLTYIGSMLFLPVWLSRNVKDPLDRMLSRGKPQRPWDFSMPPHLVNSILTELFGWESTWVQAHELPVGTSLLVLVRVES